MGPQAGPLYILQSTLGPKCESNIPYNEFITPTTFIRPIIGILMDSHYRILTLGIHWAHSMTSRHVNAATRLAEASLRRDNTPNWP